MGRVIAVGNSRTEGRVWTRCGRGWDTGFNRGQGTMKGPGLMARWKQMKVEAKFEGITRAGRGQQCKHEGMVANKTQGSEGKMILAHGGWVCGSRQRELLAAEGMAGVRTWQWAMGATADRAGQEGKKGCAKEEQR